MTEREALKLALAALECLIEKTRGRSIRLFMETERQMAISACVGILDALAQHDSVQAKPEPEHCKYGYEPKSCTSDPMNCQCAHDAVLEMAEQEPVQITGFDCVCGRRMVVSAEQGVVSASQRKPLTDEEIDQRLCQTNNEHEHDDRFWDGVEWAKAQIKENK